MELFLEVMEKTTGMDRVYESVHNYGRSPEYWVGWMITHYQWYSGCSFQSVLDVVPYGELLNLYGTLHEADIQKSYEVLDDHFENGESKLKAIRKRCGITQETLAKESGVLLNAIRAYERKSKDLNKTQFDIIMNISGALKCEVYELLE